MKLSAARQKSATTIVVGMTMTANVIRVGPEHPAALAFEEKLKTHYIAWDKKAGYAVWVPR